MRQRGRRRAPARSISSPTRRASSGPSHTPMTRTLSPRRACVHKVLPSRSLFGAIKAGGGGEDVRAWSDSSAPAGSPSRPGNPSRTAGYWRLLRRAMSRWTGRRRPPRRCSCAVCASSRSQRYWTGVGILILVHHDVAEALLILLQHRAIGPEQGQHVQQQIAEIAGVERAQPGLIGGVESLRPCRWRRPRSRPHRPRRG